MKVAYLIECMHNSGGMERVLTVCANALCQELDISIITLYQKARSYYFPLDKSVICYDLGLSGVANRKLIKERMSEFLMNHHFDIVISLGGMDMYYLNSIKDGSRKILWFHFAIDIAKTTWVGPNPNVFQKVKAQLQTWKRIYYAKKFHKVIVISKADLGKWLKYTDEALLIYNPITIESTRQFDRSTKCVISVGRLDFQKGYDYLIPAWNIVVQKHPDWHLNIYGEGPLRYSIQKQIDELKLSNAITLCGRTSNIGGKYASHSIYVMSSRAEGFPLVLLEASSCGIPLISFDCPSGPREIIEDGINGFLVKRVGDIEGMADAICELIENESLRNEMGNNAKAMVNKFSIDSIRPQWISLFNSL